VGDIMGLRGVEGEEKGWKENEKHRAVYKYHKINK